MIDVIIPCYNAEQTLVRAVQSALNQAELGKIWLVDDASTDGTLELMLSLKKQFPEKICIEQMPKNGGVAKARNWGALQSEEEFIAFLDADDAYEPQALQVAGGRFGRNENGVHLRIEHRYQTSPNPSFLKRGIFLL